MSAEEEAKPSLSPQPSNVVALVRKEPCGGMTSSERPVRPRRDSAQERSNGIASFLWQTKLNKAMETGDPRDIRVIENQARIDWRNKLIKGQSKPSILLVEPTPGLRRKFKKTLEAEGFDVHVPKQCDLHSVIELPGINSPIKDKKTSYDLIVFGERTQPEKRRPDDKAYRLLLNNRFSVPILFIGCNTAVKQVIDEGKSEDRPAYAFQNKPFKAYIDRRAFYSEQGREPLSRNARSQLLAEVFPLLTQNYTHSPECFNRA